MESYTSPEEMTYTREMKREVERMVDEIGKELAADTDYLKGILLGC